MRDAAHNSRPCIRCREPGLCERRAPHKAVAQRGNARCASDVAALEPAHAAELGIDDFAAHRAPARGYRTAPLRGPWTHLQGGFYHDGRFAARADVVNHYDLQCGLHLRPQEERDLMEYLKWL